jgi:hypothetical protein
MKLTRLKIFAVATVVALGIGAVAFWLHRPAAPPTDEDATAAIEEAPSETPSRSTDKRKVMGEVALMVTYLSADNREGARQLAQRTAPGITIADAMNLLRDTRTDAERDISADWQTLRQTAYQTVAVAELMQFLPPPSGPNPTWNALRQELKEASYDFSAAVLSRDMDQAQRASRRLHASCVECHQRFQYVPVRVTPIPIGPSPPEPSIDFSAFSGELSTDVMKAAEFMMHGEYENGRAWTERIAKRSKCAEVMALFGSRKRGGLGTLATWPDRRDDGIETALLQLEKKLPSDFRRGELEAMACQIATIAEVVKALPPRPRMEESQWRKWTLRFRNAAFDLALVLHDRDAPSIHVATARVNEACLGCHAQVGVPVLAERPKLQSTAELLAILEGRPDDRARGHAYLSRQRSVAIEELASRKEELVKLGAPLTRAVEAALADSDEDVRLTAMQMLTRLKEVDALPVLIHALEDEDAMVRGRAGIALSRLGKGAVPELRKLLKTGKRDTRASTLGTLARIGGDARESVPDLIPLLKDEDPLLQKLAGDALRKIDPDAAKNAGVK